jgi:roadblock/LC7 domain-containing protein
MTLLQDPKDHVAAVRSMAAGRASSVAASEGMRWKPFGCSSVAGCAELPQPSPSF